MQKKQDWCSFRCTEYSLTPIHLQKLPRATFGRHRWLCSPVNEDWWRRRLGREAVVWLSCWAIGASGGCSWPVELGEPTRRIPRNVRDLQMAAPIQRTLQRPLHSQLILPRPTAQTTVFYQYHLSSRNLVRSLHMHRLLPCMLDDGTIFVVWMNYHI